MKKLPFLVFLFLLFSLFPAPLSLDVSFIENKKYPHTENLPTNTVLRIAAFGDVMMHYPQIQAGKITNEVYDFHPFFYNIQAYLHQADIAIGNLETTFGGNARPYRGYPRFNSPDALANALKMSGVDILSTANNHALDTGISGTIRTYNVVKKAGILPIGTAPTEKQSHAIWLKKRGICLAFLAYTHSTNGLRVPSNRPYLLNRFPSKKMIQDIQQAKKKGAELILVSLHFGVEYQRKPNDFQKKLARQALESGADVILGNHPHVVQPMEKISLQGKEKLIIYSMGNFISNQSFPYTNEGVIIYIDVEKDTQTKKVNLKKIFFLPTYVKKTHLQGKKTYRIIPLPSSQDTHHILPKQKWYRIWKNIHDQMNAKGTFPDFASASS